MQDFPSAPCLRSDGGTAFFSGARYAVARPPGTRPGRQGERPHAEGRVFETLIGFGLIALFCLVGWAVGAAAEPLIRSGIGLATLGFLVGIPTAIVYHWRLYCALTRCNRLPPRWWISPTSHHDRIPSADRRQVLSWGALGGAGFVAVVLGIVLTSLGLWRLLAA